MPTSRPRGTRFANRAMTGFPPRRVQHFKPLMWISPTRIFYVGLLGKLRPRAFGAWILYSAVDRTLEMRVGKGRWRPCDAAIIAPGVRHQVRSAGRLVATYLIELESADDRRLRELVGGGEGVLPAGVLPGRVRRLYARLSRVPAPRLETDSVDRALLGGSPGTRAMDARIAAVTNAIRERPFASYSAAAAAQAAGLSYSRFLHLFKEQMGIPFRAYRVWKRAREMLYHVNRPVNLARLALETGYPDSTYFSHTIRHVFGLNPREIFTGSRRLTLFADAADAAAPGSSRTGVLR